MTDLAAYGIGVELPRGWDGRIYRRSVGPPVGQESRAPASASGVESSAETSIQAVGLEGTANPVAHLANFALPEGRGDYGSGAVERMRPSDVLVCILEFDPEAAATALFSRRGVPRFRVGDFSPSTMQRTIVGMSGAQAFFSEGGRAFCAYVVIGSHGARASLVPEVNRLLAGLTIEPA